MLQRHRCDPGHGSAAAERARGGSSASGSWNPTLNEQLLPELIRRFRLTAPDVEIALLDLTTLEQTDALKEGRIDIGFG